MVRVSAICDGCGFAFPSGLNLDTVAEAGATDNQPGPCPRCGAMGHVPDGIAHAYQSSIEIIEKAEASNANLEVLAQLLGAFTVSTPSVPEDLAVQIERYIPRLGQLADLVRFQEPGVVLALTSLISTYVWRSVSRS